MLYANPINSTKTQMDSVQLCYI